MFARHTIYRIAASLLGVIAVAGTSFAAPRQCGDYQRRDLKSGCGIGRPCCCGKTAGSGACCCQRDEEPPAPLPAKADDQGRVPMGLPSSGAATTLLLAAAPQQPDWSLGTSFISTFAPSVQSLLCVWRF